MNNHEKEKKKQKYKKVNEKSSKFPYQENGSPNKKKSQGEKSSRKTYEEYVSL